MAPAIDQLPNDVATLKRLLIERDAEVVQRLAELEAQRAEVLVARLLIEKLKLQIARLRRPKSRDHFSRSPLAEQALTQIQGLYAIEAEIRGKSPDERRRVRQARAGPLLDTLQQWLLATRAKLSAKSELAGAINYALKLNAP